MLGFLLGYYWGGRSRGRTNSVQAEDLHQVRVRQLLQKMKAPDPGMGNIAIHSPMPLWDDDGGDTKNLVDMADGYAKAKGRWG